MPRKTPSLSFLRPRSPLQNDESPSSPASPLTPPPSSPPSSPSTPSSSSSSFSSDPPTAPAPLHLRTLISPPPAARLNPRIQATAPKVPYPWIWKCHLCSSVYRLGVTRRCLEDGHFFCSIPSPPPSPPHSTFSSSSSSSSSDRHSQGALGAGFGDPVELLLRAKERERKERRRERKRKAAKGCKAEFDYTGWSGYNDWRREVRAIRYGEFGNLIFDERARSKKDCWRDCDFPSECLNEMVRERESRVRREKMRVLEEEWAKEQARVQDLMDAEFSSSSSSNDDGDVEMHGVDEVDTAQFYDTEKCSEHENAHGDEAEMCGVVAEEPGEEKPGENLGPLGTDCDGLGEESKEAAYAKCRRKSLDAAAEGDVVPSSPLKECAFGFEDVDLGCSVWASEVGKVKVEVDVQMAEVEQETQVSLLSKKVGLGDEDEEDGMSVQPRGAQKWRSC